MNASSSAAPPRRDHATTGVLLGVGAYALWGVLPIYFKLLHRVPAVDIVAHRVLWSVPFLLALVALARGFERLREALRSRRTMALLALTALLIGINWLFYVYAVVTGRILAGSLGYYLNPLANVLLGRIFLHERLSRLQWAAVIIAGLGISALALQALDQLWLSLVLCCSFAAYGLLRKIAPVDSVAGLTIETSLILPLALLWLGWRASAGEPVFGVTRLDLVLLLAAGVATAVPLLLFTAAARRLRYSTLGMLQFLAPTLQFLIAVLVYGEAFTSAHAIAFGAIWIALILYVAGLGRSPRLPVPPE